MHGDFRLGNCIVDDRGEIRAVLDWEICTLGDPRADVGYVLATWAEPGDPLRADDHNPTLAPGFTTRDVLLARYAERSGRDVERDPLLRGVLVLASRLHPRRRARPSPVGRARRGRRRPRLLPPAGGQLRAARRGIRSESLIDDRREHAVPTRAPAITVAGYSHVAIMVDDLDAALAFYCDTLGFSALPRPDFGPGTEGAWLQLGTAQVHLGHGRRDGRAVRLPAPRAPHPGRRVGRHHGRHRGARHRVPAAAERAARLRQARSAPRSSATRRATSSSSPTSTPPERRRCPSPPGDGPVLGAHAPHALPDPGHDPRGRGHRRQRDPAHADRRGRRRSCPR